MLTDIERSWKILIEVMVQTSSTTMLAEARRRLLRDLISRRGFATLEDLITAVGASESTIRRDLDALDREGVVKRTHGGAVVASDARSLPSFDDRITEAPLEKQAIGRATAELIADGETVLLDGGTTTLEVARALLNRPVQVVTNSLPIASLLASSPATDLILIGGYVYPKTGVALGPLAIQSLASIRVRKVVMGAGGLVAEGVYNQNSLLVETERAMMECGQEVVIVADATKFGRSALTWLCDLSAIHRVITDSRLSVDTRRMIESKGVQLAIAATSATGTEERPTSEQSETRGSLEP
jgi:DeoR/GlpR family transcriptional regulator of sugar metabolism